jgi:hypothetical protein
MTKRNLWLRVGLDAWSLGLEGSLSYWTSGISTGGRRAEAEARSESTCTEQSVKLP